MKLLYIKWILILLCIPFMTACWENLPVYEGAEITKVGFYHRFAGSEIDPVTNEPIVVEKELSCSYDINSETATIDVDIIVPEANGSFTESERNNVSVAKLWGYVNVSTAARVEPIDGSPKLGTPGDWSSPRKYKVIAANGDTKIWTITVNSLNKY